MADFCQNLASKYRNQGRWKEEEELEVQAMETRERVLVAEHPDHHDAHDDVSSIDYG
jgi:hypothetical protein